VLLLQLLSKKKSEYNASATYTFADLMRDLITSVLPKHWCFIKLPNQIVFYHNNNKVTTTVIINSSMGIIVRIIFLKIFYIVCFSDELNNDKRILKKH
jgi:hypothetical protein